MLTQSEHDAIRALKNVRDHADRAIAAIRCRNQGRVQGQISDAKWELDQAANRVAEFPDPVSDGENGEDQR